MVSVGVAIRSSGTSCRPVSISPSFDHLAVVDGCGDHCLAVDAVELSEDGELQVAVRFALSNPVAGAVN